MELDWYAPKACSLPSADQPVRAAEWDALFADAVGDMSPIVGGVRFTLERGVARPAAVADLVDRESRCCPFLGFSVTVGAGTLTLDVTSESGHGSVVEALAARAAALRTP